MIGERESFSSQCTKTHSSPKITNKCPIDQVWDALYRYSKVKSQAISQAALPKERNTLSVAAKKTTAPQRVISIGNIVHAKQDISKSFDIDIDSLTNHALICGATGSGKTNTCFSLLQQLWQQKIPFLVIEPARSEYRHFILGSKVFKGDGQVYTLGDESTSPFRLNPFEIMKGVKVAAHIEALTAIFNASFEMYWTMPQVLDCALN